MYLKKVYFFVALLTCLLIVVKSFDYIHPDFSSGFLSDKGEIFFFYRYFLYAHIAASPIVLLSGLFQFTFTKGIWHRLAGKVYVGLVVFLAAPSGLAMSWFAIGGFWGALNFALLSVLWFVFTLNAYQFIRKRDFDMHRQFMTRSFILANSAIALRLLSFINAYFGLMDITFGYVVISWASWLPFLLVYEAILAIRRKKKTTVN